MEENDSLPGTVSILPRSKHLITAIEFRFATTIRLPHEETTDTHHPICFCCSLKFESCFSWYCNSRSD